MTGVILTSAPDDWAIIQKTGDSGTITLKGHYSVPEAALNVGVKYAVPVVRIMQEENNYPVIPWTPADFLLEDKERFTGFLCQRADYTVLKPEWIPPAPMGPIPGCSAVTCDSTSVLGICFS